MANEENLIPIKDSNVARELQEKSAKKKSENARQRKLWKDEIMKRLGENDWNTIVDNLINRAKKNDKSFEVLRDTMGQKPVDNTQVKETLPPVVNIEIKDNSEVQKEFDKFDT